MEELLARAENMIRENTQHCNEMQHIPETSAANADRMQQLNAQVNSLIDHSPADSGQSSNPAPVPNSAGESCMCGKFEIQKLKTIIETLNLFLQFQMHLCLLQMKCPMS